MVLEGRIVCHEGDWVLSTLGIQIRVICKVVLKVPMTCYEGHCVLSCDDISFPLDVDRRIIFICHNDERTMLKISVCVRARAHAHTHHVNMYARQHDTSFLKIVIWTRKVISYGVQKQQWKSMKSEVDLYRNITVRNRNHWRRPKGWEVFAEEYGIFISDGNASY
jgi:hypothetical protein